MTLETILNIIHKEGVETEIFKALSEWIVNDRQQQIVKVARSNSTLRAISKIANGNSNRREAIEGIKNLCEEGEEV